MFLCAGPGDREDLGHKHLGDFGTGGIVSHESNASRRESGEVKRKGLRMWQPKGESSKGSRKRSHQGARKNTGEGGFADAGVLRF